MSVEVSVLESFGREAHMRRKWMRMWETLGERILKMPQCVNTAIKNRIATLEMIQNAKRRN
jgi:hypothetical protein